MVIRSETIKGSLTEDIARLGEEGSFKPKSPEKVIKPEKKKYTLDQLIEMTEEDLTLNGISTEIVGEMIDVGQEELIVFERNAGREKAMVWAFEYWKQLNSGLSKNLEKSPNRGHTLYNDSRLRALGVVKFLEFAKDYIAKEDFDFVHDTMLTACDLFILAEANTVPDSIKLTYDATSRSMKRALAVGLQNPDILHNAFELLESSTENLYVLNEIGCLEEGIKAEFVVARILTNFDYPDIGYEISVSKASTMRDVEEETDLILTIRQNRFRQELAIIDIKKTIAAVDNGCCRVEGRNGEITFYNGIYPNPNVENTFCIEERFINAVRKGSLQHSQDYALSGLVIRLPPRLISVNSIAELVEMDIEPTHEYNELKENINRELGLVLGRIGNKNANEEN